MWQNWRLLILENEIGLWLVFKRTHIAKEISNQLICSLSLELEKTKMELRELQLRERELQVLKNTFQSKSKKFEANTTRCDFNSKLL